MGEIKPFLSSCTFIFDHIFYCAFFIILILVGIDKKENQFGNNLEWFHSFDMKIHKKLQKKSQNLLKVLPKTVLFRNIALIFSFEKPCYLENRVVREPCKQRTACIRFRRWRFFSPYYLDFYRKQSSSHKNQLSTWTNEFSFFLCSLRYWLIGVLCTQKQLEWNFNCSITAQG